MAEGLGEGYDDQFKSVKKDIENSINFDTGTITADANICRHYTSGSYGAASTSGGGDSGKIVMLLEQYLPMLANMKVIMDRDVYKRQPLTLQDAVAHVVPFVEPKKVTL